MALQPFQGTVEQGGQIGAARQPGQAVCDAAPPQLREALPQADVVALTGTSLINGTCDELLAGLGNPRAAVLLGPSTPLCGEAFSGTKIWKNWPRSFAIVMSPYSATSRTIGWFGTDAIIRCWPNRE